MSRDELPIHPRLASHVLARRHIVDGEDVVVLHDPNTGDLVRIGPREWNLLAQADGTRDFDGICLAAARVGAYRRASEIRTLLLELHQRKLIDDGVEHPPSEETPPDLPLDVLPDFSLHCDASGECCGTYGSILFTSAEVARARALVPHVLAAGDDEERAFMPDHGTRSASRAVALVDGRCAYLAASGRCSIHEAGGEFAKPRGCRVYPASFVDDGEAIRVSVGVECACVLASVGRTGGSPLIAASVQHRRELERGTHVVRLLDRIALSSNLTASRADLIAWSRAVLAQGDPADVPSAFIALAETAIPELNATRVASALEAPRVPDPAAIAPYIEALASRMSGRIASTEAWRSSKDRARITTRWLAEAVGTLRDREALASVIGTANRGAAEHAAESFYFRGAIHGHHLVDEVSLERALRDRAVRVIVARALGPVIARHAPSDPSARYPLALVEGMMRAHGIKAYAREIPVA